MSLTPAQIQTLSTYIASVPAWAALPRNDDTAFFIAAELNKAAIPAFTVWRTSVSAEEIMGNGFVWTAVDGLTPGKARIWEWMTRFGTINPSKANIRQGLADCFGAGSAMATSIMPHLKRSASVIEKLFAAGTGTDAVPATMAYEGPVGYQEVVSARNLG